MTTRKFLLVASAALVFAADPKLSPEMQIVADHISADSLRGHLSFLASDLLEGRATPSRGLDLAAEYIAAEFRRAGLEPVGDDGYFQTASVVVREPNPDGFEMTVTSGGKTVRVPADQAAILLDKPLRIDDVPIVMGATLTPEQSKGKVVILGGRGGRQVQPPQGAVLVLYATPGTAGPQVSDPETPGRGFARNAVSSPELTELLKDAKDARVTLHATAAIERTVKVRNVAGILRGSDRSLEDTYVMLTAHYDHIGMRATGDDKIFNGANDDGSGTVSVIEIASALAALKPHPKRSVIFVAFFGEERGLLGSRYYGRHPLVPLDKTIADLNLEQVGRTDATNGPQIGTATITGFDFSTLPRIIGDAGKLVGVKVYKDNEASDPYFSRSDNQALADVGIPAHTLSVAVDYPDYHGVGDHWRKIDYDNMAKVDRAIAVGLLHMASDAPPPKWNESNSAATKYADAARKLHP